MFSPRSRPFLCLPLALFLSTPARAEEDLSKAKWVPSTAYGVPKETATEGEGYFPIIEARNGRLYIGTPPTAVNSWLVGFVQGLKQVHIVGDTLKEIGSDLRGC